MPRVELEAVGLEFEEGGNTIWVHGPDGGTILRIKCTGRIAVKCCAGLSAHADVIVEGDIAFCVPGSTLVERRTLELDPAFCGRLIGEARDDEPRPLFMHTIEHGIEGTTLIRLTPKT